MRLGLVGFAASRKRAGGVEITQGGEMQPVDLVVPVQRLLDGELGVSVGVGRAERRLFAQRFIARLIHCRGGRQHETRHAGLDRRFDQQQRIDQVVAQELGRILHALAGFDEGGKMHHGVEFAVHRMSVPAQLNPPGLPG